MDSSRLKQKLHEHCRHYVEERITLLRNVIQSSQDAANSETKSSAGDKYETGRAMAQMEVERGMEQLNEAEKLGIALNRANNSHQTETVTAGSLVVTSQRVFYLAISIGKVVVDGVDYFVISPESPIGKLLLGKKAGDEFAWKNERYVIMSVN